MLTDIDLDWYNRLPDEHKEEWLFERTACDTSLYYFIIQMGSFAVNAGGDASIHIHKPICDFWQDDTIKRKFVHMPRGWLKSTLWSKWGNLWRYLVNPEVRILMPSQKIDLPSDFVKWIKNQAIRNTRLRWLYPRLQLIDKAWIHSNRWGSIDCEMPRDGIYAEPTFRAIGITGGAQGGHYNFIDPDDLISEKGMESAVIMEDAFRWFDNIEELLDDPQKDIISGKGTHWSPGDLGVYIQENYPEYKWMIVPCRKDSNLKDTHNITWMQNPTVGDGESNWLEKFPTEYYVDMLARPEKQIVYWSQHMNIPGNATTLTKFDPAWLRYYDLEQAPNGDWYLICEGSKESFRLKDIPLYGMIDPGGFSEVKLMKKGSRNAMVIGGQPPNSVKKFVLYTYARRLKSPSEFLDEFFTAHAKWRPRHWKIEVIGAQEYIKRDIQEEAKRRSIYIPLASMEKKNTENEKDNDIQSLIPVMEAGEIYIHRNMKDLIGEIKTYPGGLTKDLIDMMGKLNKYCWKRGKRENLPRFGKPSTELLDGRSGTTGY